MQRNKVLCAIFSTCILSFYSFAMEKERSQTSNKEIISLIAIIKTQQNILGYTPPTDVSCIPEYFESAFERIAKIDPKDDRAKIYEKLIKDAAVTCINTIIYEHPLFEDRIRLIVELFGKNSINYLRKAIEENEKVLKKQQLFDYYQHITKQQPAPMQTPTTSSSTKSTQTQQPQEIIEQLPEIKPIKKAVKDNEIQFTELTYKGLTYNYQAYKYWIDKDLNCNINDPFINVEIIAFDEDGNTVFQNKNMPLPLPVLLDDKGHVKSEIFLPLSPRPFTVNYKNTQPLQNALPQMALNFYKNVDNIFENDEEYLLKKNVIQKEGDTYIHGQNSCRPLLEEYFRLWDIPEDQYKPYSAEATKDKPEEQKEGWAAKIWKRTKRFFGKVNYFFETVYYSLLAMKTAIFGEPPVRKSSTAAKRAAELRKMAENEEQNL